MRERKGSAWGRLLVGLLLAGLAGSAQAAAPCTFFAAPLPADGGRPASGEPPGLTGNPGTVDAPIPVSDFWKRGLARPGNTLCLKDGLYRGRDSMLSPPAGEFAGKPGRRVTIRALNDGNVWIDGEFEHRNRLQGQHYWTLEGLNIYNSVGSALKIRGTAQTKRRDQDPIHHVELRRIVAWKDYIPFGSREDYDRYGGWNSKVLDVVDATDVLIEDSAGFGHGRKIFASYRSHRITFRRLWARWDGRWPYQGGNKFAYTCSYKTYDSLCENLIAVLGGTSDVAAYPPDYDPGVQLISADGPATRDDRWLRPVGRDANALGLRVFGSLAFAAPEARFPKVVGIRFGGTHYPNKGHKGIEIAHIVSAIPPTGRRVLGLQNCDDDPVKHPEGCSWEVGDTREQSPLRVRNATLIGGAKGVAIHRDWQAVEIEQVPWGEAVDIYRSDTGASLCMRTVNGKPTATPLWPWPMQERIRAATRRSNWEEADVMAAITARFGAPPPACTKK